MRTFSLSILHVTLFEPNSSEAYSKAGVTINIYGAGSPWLSLPPLVSAIVQQLDRRSMCREPPISKARLGIVVLLGLSFGLVGPYFLVAVFVRSQASLGIGRLVVALQTDTGHWLRKEGQSAIGGVTDSNSHLVEIFLLRDGDPSVAKTGRGVLVLNPVLVPSPDKVFAVCERPHALLSVVGVVIAADLSLLCIIKWKEIETVAGSLIQSISLLPGRTTLEAFLRIFVVPMNTRPDFPATLLAEIFCAKARFGILGRDVAGRRVLLSQVEIELYIPAAIRKAVLHVIVVLMLDICDP